MENAAQKSFREVCTDLADAIYAVMTHEDCPLPVENALVDLHCLVMRAYASDIAQDVKRRFADVLASAVR